MLLLRFAGLLHVPFTFHACSEQCKLDLVSKYGIIQKQLQDQLDQEYQEQVRAAQEFVGRGGEVDISPENINAPRDGVEHFVAPNFRVAEWAERRRRRRRKRCSII